VPSPFLLPAVMAQVAAPPLPLPLALLPAVELPAVAFVPAPGEEVPAVELVPPVASSRLPPPPPPQAPTVITRLEAPNNRIEVALRM
jgi:hypothetical protein